MTLNQTSGSRMVTGLFPDRATAERAYNDVSSRGYRHDDVNLVMSDETRKRHFLSDGAPATELGTKAAEGAGIGGAIGGSIGAIAAAIAAVGTTVALPGLGLVIAGPLAAAIAGAGAGAATGGIVGALIGWGIPEERVKHYEEGIKNGGILMGVTPRSDDDARYFESRWQRHEGSTSSAPASARRRERWRADRWRRRRARGHGRRRSDRRRRRRARRQGRR